MWPGDIKETIDKVGNLPEGGRPFFFHEVIDQGGEVIKVQEYYGVGRTTEFRYGIKVVFKGTVSAISNELPDVNALKQQSSRILSIASLKLKLKTNTLQFLNVHVHGYKKKFISLWGKPQGKGAATL